MGNPAFAAADRKSKCLAALFAAGHDGGVEAFLEVGGKIVKFMRAVDFDGLAGGVEDDLAVLAAVHVLFKLGARLGGDFVVDQVVEKGKKLFAGHFFSLPVSPNLVSLGPFSRWK
jgi:hypothetical protein